MRRPGWRGPHSIWSLSHQRLLRQHQSVGTKFLSLISSLVSVSSSFYKDRSSTNKLEPFFNLWFSILTLMQEKYEIWGKGEKKKQISFFDSQFVSFNLDFLKFLRDFFFSDIFNFHTIIVSSNMKIVCSCFVLLWGVLVCMLKVPIVTT